MPSLFEDPEHWRSRAEEARAIAGEMRDHESRRIMLDIALDYDRLAKRADGHKSKIRLKAL